MNLKILSLFGTMILAVAVWFFYKEDVKIKPTTPTTPDVSYEVEEIKAVQTNAKTGEVEYTLIAQSLTKNAQGEDVMLDADVLWQPSDASPIHLTANQAKHSQTTGEIWFDEGFILTKQNITNQDNQATTNQNTDDENLHAKADLIIKGTSLAGNTKSNTIKSDEPIHITQGENSFMAQRLDGNVQTGEYEFHQVQIEFNPPKRTDKPLF
ncbi:LPS export ABC transporter periplasmic protein LptC [Moraxella oblonga]|uniref:LPS export ABC transporter periplasmic protein LptC n=1 Tax=Moraxella oblonga TaxID=200413 RepID=UPI000833A574|nr:LPS export ABC transporter periplasmic protein LptC [Moraxella oblonga]